MPKSENQKAKLLYIRKFLLEEADENHPLTVNQIIEKLAGQGIKAERKSIYDDINTLREFGMDVICERSRSNGYFIGERNFQLAELKILVDAVAASKFITVKKTGALINKLEACANKFEAGALQRQIYVKDRIKNMQESVYYTIDKIHQAIAQNRQLTFKYLEWTLNKDLHPRKNGVRYLENPLALYWEDDNYYLITYNAKHKKNLHYRVDRMTEVELTEDACDAEAGSDKFDVVQYVKKHFSMFSGEETTVEICFDKSLIGVALERFGKELEIIKSDSDNFTAKVEVAVSPQFYGWLVGLGTKAKITEPSWVKKEYAKRCKKISNLYK